MTASGRDRSDRGAAAVEFALIVPVLLLLLLGIVEFGRAYHAQLSVSAAAREAVRVMAIDNDVDAAVSTARNAAASLVPPVDEDLVVVTPEQCAPGIDVTVVIEYPMVFITGAFAPDITLTGIGVMRCGG